MKKSVVFLLLLSAAGFGRVASAACRNGRCSIKRPVNQRRVAMVVQPARVQLIQPIQSAVVQPIVEPVSQSDSLGRLHGDIRRILEWAPKGIEKLQLALKQLNGAIELGDSVVIRNSYADFYVKSERDELVELTVEAKKMITAYSEYLNELITDVDFLKKQDITLAVTEESMARVLRLKESIEARINEGEALLAKVYDHHIRRLEHKIQVLEDRCNSLGIMTRVWLKVKGVFVS